MAGKRIDTMDLRQLISLKKQGVSNRKVAQLLQISRNTVNGYTSILEHCGLSYDQLLGLDELALKELCAPTSEISPARYEALASQFEYFLTELKKPGCTLLTLWNEYRHKHPDPYGYTQFTHHYNQWASRFSFIAIPNLNDDTYRLKLEKKLIATLNNGAFVSSSWLGLDHPDEKIRNSGLWNIQHLRHDDMLNADDLNFIKNQSR